MSAILFILLSAITLLSAHQIYVRNIEKGRIYGGVDTSIEQIAYQVSVLLNGKHNCGGSIYSPKIIITAAHCLYSLNAKDLSVRAGSSIRNSGGSLVKVSKIFIHEQYSSSPVLNDIALLLLRKPLKLSNRIQTISLALSEPKEGTSVIVSGWGVTENEKQPTNLKSVNVNIVSREKCIEAYKDMRLSKISEETICAAASGKDACSKDSGGPLVHNKELVGIVSWGKGCAHPNYPGVYANVALYNNWIKENAAKLLL